MKRRTSSGASRLVERPAGELGEQQPLNDAQAAAARAGTQALHIAHMRVVARKLVGDRAVRVRQIADDTALAQQRQRQHECGVRVTRLPNRRASATAVRQMLVYELLDATLVEPIGREPAQCHPMQSA